MDLYWPGDGSFLFVFGSALASEDGLGAAMINICEMQITDGLVVVLVIVPVTELAHCLRNLDFSP